MGFAIGLCAVLGLVATGLAYFPFRRRPWISPVAGILVFGASLAWFLTPVCVAVTEEEQANFDPPIATRSQTGMIGQQIFQQRDGRWFHCKVRITRQMFF